MDVTKITDIKELKALAYDQMVLLERAQQNLGLLNARINELNQEQTPKTPQPQHAKGGLVEKRLH